VQNSSMKASVVQPIAAGSTVAVNPLITPPARNRSTRRFTAGADSDTLDPMSAYELRASCWSNAMICWSTASMRNKLLLPRNMSFCWRHRTVPTFVIVRAMERKPRKRTYLMCRPDHFAVKYAINPWMDPSAAVDGELALKQWERLRETLVGLGHLVHELPPEPGLPDMVYAANGAFSVDGVAYGALFRYPQRVAEAAAHRAWYEAMGGWRYVAPTATNEGEGDFAYLPEVRGGLVLAGYGFRTDLAAHVEAQEALRRPVVSLHLTDPRLYHLDVALAALDDSDVAYYPGAFSPATQEVLRRMFPAAVLADEQDAMAFGLNLISDGRHAVLNSDASAFGSKLRAAGYEPVHVELGELKKGGGSVRCCIAELRS
jgi:arginine dihydrolase